MFELVAKRDFVFRRGRNNRILGLAIRKNLYNETANNFA
jgi:hypothetical protein